MAEDVPACDVLCEAMEYLAKLGSNLRARSENLKEKRISREKLKNSHAVHKAASKVLLICELSKKSLDNVEVGVRKVLSLIDRGVASSSGAKTSNVKTISSGTDGHYIIYQSRKLRVAKKVPLKHYMSVKVLTRKMSTAVLNKYPVYHDCKLYRQRRVIERKGSKDSVDGSVKRKNSVHVYDTAEKNRNNKDKSAKSEKLSKSEKNNEGIKNKHFSSEKRSESAEDKNHRNKLKDNFKSNSIDRDEKRTNINDESVQILDSDEKQIDIVSNKNMKTDSIKDYSKPSSVKSNKSDQNNRLESDDMSSDKHKTFKSSREIDLLKDDQNIRKKHIESKRKKYRNIIISDDNSEDEKKTEIAVKKSSSKSVQILSDKNKSGINNDSTKCTTVECEPDVNNIECDQPLRKNSEKIGTDNSNRTEKVMSDAEMAEKENGNDEETKGDEKPLIRCVNISKLLKPDIVKNKTESVNTISKLGIKDNRKRELNSQENKTVGDIEIMDDDYWAQKRKEVKAFRSKKLSIPVTRLPKFTTNFLQLHNLKQITQAGVILYQNEEARDAVKNISEAKSALLNDSECESESESTSKVAERAQSEPGKNTPDPISSKEAHKVGDLEEINGNKKESQSKQMSVDNENNVLKEKTHCATTIKNALLNDSDSDVNDEPNKGKVNETPKPSNIDTGKIKASLLQDSDSEKDKQPDIHHDINKFNKGFTFNMKDFEALERKVTEIIKSNLLNDSDSDKNNDGITIPEKNDKTNNSNNNGDQCHDNSNADDKSQKDVPNNKSDETADPPSEEPEKIKSALLNDSSDSEGSLKKTKEKPEQVVADSESAKKKLLTKTSSSDAENEQSDGSTGANTSKKPKRKQRKKIINRSGSSSSSEDVTSNPKKVKLDSKPPRKSSKGSSKGSVGSSDDRSKHSSRKMVRSKAKPSGSSGQNSDNPDASDKDIDGLTNLNSLKKSHRRRTSASPTGTNNSQDTSSTTKRSRQKPSVIGEDLLQADSSSEAPSHDEIADSDIEDMPPVSMVGLNGGSIDTLAKDDLLGDTDSSGTQEKVQIEETRNLDDSEEDNNVKLKRRKAHAISSDSEAGSSRRKNRHDDGKVSDFEDSEDDSSESAKKSKRKKAGSESDGSGESSDAGKKKRRRIKPLDSEASGSDTETEGRNKHGRKNIRKVMGKNQLEEATKKAAREEKERIARITERQKLYNNLEFDESGKPDEVILEKVVLDFDPETKEPLIEVDRGLVKKLKPHQANGIKFMWDACFESVKRIKKDRGSGCILAHCMGLGKTLQVISLTHTLLAHSSLTGVKRVLVVCPLSTVLNWVNEVRLWLKHAHADFEVDVYELSRYKQNSERAFQLQQWFEHGGVCVLGYEMYRNLSADNSKKYKKKMLKSFQESLVDPGPDLVVCDEGHLLKNEKTSLSQSMNRVKTRRRIVLTGTPLQNNLKEYYCMVQFVKPNLLGKFNEYLNRFVNPITNGQYTDSTEHDIRVMKRRSHVLHKMLDGAVQRRDYGVLAPFLPPKHEYVLFITLTEVQIKLYQFYLDNYSRRPLPGKSSGFLFPDFQSLQRIWTHPLVLKYNSERYEIMQQKKREREEEDDSEGSLVNFIDDDSTPDESSTEESSDDLSDLSDDSRKKSKKKKASKKGKVKDTKVSTRRGTRANPVEMEEDEPVADEVMEAKNENPTEWWIKLVADAELDDLRNSHKLVLLFDILRQCEAIGDKLLVFSQSLYSLDLIEHFLGKVDEATQEGRIDEKLGGHVGSWSPGVDYFRLDGSTSCENRSIWCKNFNREDNPRARLFLISTRAGGLGINLVAANRVVIFDVSWNPSHDVQSIFRVYRFGQKKPCYVYRFLAMGTMEEKIYERQVTKQAISKRVIDEQQIDRHYAENDLAELYKFEPQPPQPRPLPPLPKDRLFAEMLREHDTQIYKYHEHDSLLENKEEETLSEEERKAAWEDFENEKNKPPPAPFPAWPMHNGMVPGLLAQQQQQLAFAALAAMLRKDMPNINDNQIRDMLPLIYNSNPALMQKMGEIYKYAQPGMMNPGMMNPVMNPGGGGAALGGSSGLQYEPPWQRQHQQQQQLRLQQLMQQQNQMGAKFYAGGLGSRDPVAMALQQQRAREIMLGGAAPAAALGRPRGRPPHALRQPPPPAHDVVDLDSD